LHLAKQMSQPGSAATGAERLDPIALDRMVDRRLQPDRFLDAGRTHHQFLDLGMGQAGNLTGAKRDNVLLQPAEDDPMDVEQVAADADADDLAIAGIVLLGAGGETAEQQMPLSQILPRADNDLMTGIIAMRPASLAQLLLILFTQGLPATQLGDETVHVREPPGNGIAVFSVRCELTIVAGCRAAHRPDRSAGEAHAATA